MTQTEAAAGIGAATIAVAAIVGALPALIAAAAIGGTAYGLTRKTLNELPREVADRQNEAMQAQITLAAQRMPQRDVDELRRKAEAKAADNAAVLEEQLSGNDAVAKMVGVASFACPVIGLAVIVGTTCRKKAGAVAPTPPGFVAWMNQRTKGP